MAPKLLSSKILHLHHHHPPYSSPRSEATARARLEAWRSGFDDTLTTFRGRVVPVQAGDLRYDKPREYWVLPAGGWEVVKIRAKLIKAAARRPSSKSRYKYWLRGRERENKRQQRQRQRPQLLVKRKRRYEPDAVWFGRMAKRQAADMLKPVAARRGGGGHEYARERLLHTVINNKVQVEGTAHCVELGQTFFPWARLPAAIQARIIALAAWGNPDGVVVRLERRPLDDDDDDGNNFRFQARPLTTSPHRPPTSTPTPSTPLPPGLLTVSRAFSARVLHAFYATTTLHFCAAADLLRFVRETSTASASDLPHLAHLVLETTDRDAFEVLTPRGAFPGGGEGRSCEEEAAAGERSRNRGRGEGRSGLRRRGGRLRRVGEKEEEEEEEEEGSRVRSDGESGSGSSSLEGDDDDDQHPASIDVSPFSSSIFYFAESESSRRKDRRRRKGRLPRHRQRQQRQQQQKNPPKSKHGRSTATKEQKKSDIHSHHGTSCCGHAHNHDLMQHHSRHHSSSSSPSSHSDSIDATTEETQRHRPARLRCWPKPCTALALRRLWAKGKEKVTTSTSLRRGGTKTKRKTKRKQKQQQESGHGCCCSHDHGHGRHHHGDMKEVVEEDEEEEKEEGEGRQAHHSTQRLPQWQRSLQNGSATQPKDVLTGLKTFVLKIEGGGGGGGGGGDGEAQRTRRHFKWMRVIEDDDIEKRSRPPNPTSTPNPSSSSREPEVVVVPGGRGGARPPDDHRRGRPGRGRVICDLRGDHYGSEVGLRAVWGAEWLVRGLRETVVPRTCEVRLRIEGFSVSSGGGGGGGGGDSDDEEQKAAEVAVVVDPAAGPSRGREIGKAGGGGGADTAAAVLQSSSPPLPKQQCKSREKWLFPSEDSSGDEDWCSALTSQHHHHKVRPAERSLNARGKNIKGRIKTHRGKQSESAQVAPWTDLMLPNDYKKKFRLKLL
ncbi:uncharacterized protein BKCO1_9000144 [Diplodia corticola]|uniref:Uncharacterized protein n=1 Tax=Diplodia corticola TaxID=236234 RepID=A0A1J9R8J0_9PEZI|nr:uncharacterized protein BKCO1_9000144 [Diplodia corticola]OJD36841.1 hypothetical protein BKCO1_9000144 [Diplodia corticola]